jgi:transcriptional regulator with XRE-family HTH domain
MDIRRQFGMRLRAKRLERGMTQEALAFRAGLNLSFLSDLERGMTQPTLEKMLLLSSALQIDVSDLVAGLRLSKSAVRRRKKPGPKPGFRSKVD